MHHLHLLLSLFLAIATPLAWAAPATEHQGQLSLSQVYDTTDKLPLPNEGNLPVHDPNIIQHDDHYYLFKGGINIPIFKSANMSGPWEKIGTVLDGDSIIHKGNRSRPWAPTTIEKDGKFYCFYTLSFRGSRNSAIGVATTTKLDGSAWTDHGVLINTGKGPGSDVYPYTITNAIDASFIIDQDSGQAYLNYGSFWHNIWQVPLSEDLLSVKHAHKPDAVQLTFVPHTNDRPEEGSWMSYRGGWYYTWFSRGKCCHFDGKFPGRGDEYSIRVGRSKNVRGPFVDRGGKLLTEGGGEVVYGSNNGVVYAPGGLGVLPASNESVPDILYYHYLDTRMGFKDGQARLGWNYLKYEDGWPVPIEGQDEVASKEAAKSSARSVHGIYGWGHLSVSMGK
ncbi:hypothetical protein N7508_005168 [Penicillium antarcticum]|uniref:uncharacterized protein n=1 Tax=Penicillium antarcticum TaxID=416450 RepID=UPI002386FE4A|nr:uncharacterized protein N7508_005168 [Penicillium antarcticum]KAJ5306153.1 hypothetical protein N7508_005168 [Penicillium antarcticum]